MNIDLEIVFIDDDLELIIDETFIVKIFMFISDHANLSLRSSCIIYSSSLLLSSSSSFLVSSILLSSILLSSYQSSSCKSSSS